MAVDIYCVVVACPNTGRAARTGVELTDESHTWNQKDAWIERAQASRLHVSPAIGGQTPQAAQ